MSNRLTSFRGERDIFLLMAEGKVCNYTISDRFGHNHSVQTGAFEEVWYNGGAYNWLETADNLRIKAGGDVNDTAAGTGAQSVIIEGLSSTLVPISATLATNGADVSLETSAEFFRVNNVRVGNVGAYGGSNAGDVIIETAGGLVVANLEATLSETQLGLYTVPAATTAYIESFRIEVDSSKTAQVRLMKRENCDTLAAPFSPWRVVASFDGLSGMNNFDEGKSPLSFPAKTDIRFLAKANTNPAGVTVEFDMILVED